MPKVTRPTECTGPSNCRQRATSPSPTSHVPPILPCSEGDAGILEAAVFFRERLSSVSMRVIVWGFKTLNSNEIPALVLKGPSNCAKRNAPTKSTTSNASPPPNAPPAPLWQTGRSSAAAVRASGVVPRLVQLLGGRDDSRVQLEAAWALTNICRCGEVWMRKCGEAWKVWEG